MTGGRKQNEAELPKRGLLPNDRNHSRSCNHAVAGEQLDGFASVHQCQGGGDNQPIVHFVDGCQLDASFEDGSIYRSNDDTQVGIQSLGNIFQGDIHLFMFRNPVNLG